MKKYFPLFLMLGCAAAFGYGLVRLVELRFQVGDVYPPYSTLRSDPLGAMAFYESLGRVRGISTRRDFSEQNLLPQKPRTVYLELGADPYGWDWVQADLAHELKGFFARGNRLVITFFPQTSPDEFNDDENGTNSANSARSKAKDERMTPERPRQKNANSEDEDRYVDLTQRWGLGVDFIKLAQSGDEYEPARVVNQTDLPLPHALDWHSGLVFTNLASSWRVIYTRGSSPVLVERHFGEGSVVMATDSYFVSNEAMEKDRHADLLAWLIGPDKNIVFDEAHFGIIQTSGIAMLMRQYRLEGVAAGLLLLAGLFIWKNASSLVPPHAEQERHSYVAGKDSAAGFVNLLRRSLAPRDLLSICFDEWKKSGGSNQYPASRRHQAETAFQAENALPAKNRNPIAAYNKICSILKARNASPKS